MSAASTPSPLSRTSSSSGTPSPTAFTPSPPMAIPGRSPHCKSTLGSSRRTSFDFTPVVRAELPISIKSWHAFVDHVQHNHGKRGHVKIQLNMTFSEVQFGGLIKYLNKTGDTVLKLDLSRCSLTREQCATLFAAINKPSFQTLQILDLRNNKLPPQVAFSLLSILPTIGERQRTETTLVIHLDGNQIDDFGAEQLLCKARKLGITVLTLRDTDTSMEMRYKLKQSVHGTGFDLVF